MRHFILVLLFALPGCPGPDLIVTPADGGPIDDAGALGDTGGDTSLADVGVDAGLADDDAALLADADSDAYTSPEDSGPDTATDADVSPLDRFEAPWGLWRTFDDAGRPDAMGRTTPAPLNGTGCTSGLGASYPVNCIAWETAAAFCAFRGLRLPTRAEWLEEASRSAPITGEVVNASMPQPTIRSGVDCYSPTCDTYGNVAEWVSDEDPAGGHLAMGAAYDDSAPSLSERTSVGPDSRIGFRCRAL